MQAAYAPRLFHAPSPSVLPTVQLYLERAWPAALSALSSLLATPATDTVRTSADTEGGLCIVQHGVSVSLDTMHCGFWSLLWQEGSTGTANDKSAGCLQKHDFLNKEVYMLLLDVCHLTIAEASTTLVKDPGGEARPIRRTVSRTESTPLDSSRLDAGVSARALPSLPCRPRPVQPATILSSEVLPCFVLVESHKLCTHSSYNANVCIPIVC